MCPLVWLLLGLVIAASQKAYGKRIVLHGASGTGPYDVATSWLGAFMAKYPEAQFTLSAVGSGATQQALLGNIDCDAKPVQAVCDEMTVQSTIWGIGDAPLDSSILQSHEWIQQLPASAGAIAVVYSKDVVGLDSDTSLRLTMEAIAGIFNATIQFWDDEKIQRLNPEISLPHERISPFVREDSSGQTSIFTDGLGYHVPSWPKDAVGKTPNWPLGMLQNARNYIGRCGNVTDELNGHHAFEADGKNGIALGMLRVPFSVGYMEMGSTRALKDFLGSVHVGKEGNPESFVQPNEHSLEETLVGLADKVDPETYELNLARVDTPVGGYPFSGYAYWYMKTKEDSFDSCYQAWLLCKLVEWAYTDEQAASLALQNGWVVPPESFANKALLQLRQIKCIDNESGVPTVISALDYVPEPYRKVGDDEFRRIVWLVVPCTLVLLLVMLVVMWLYVFWSYRRNDQLWKIQLSELKFPNPPEIIGRGTFGVVLAAEYRGTIVAVKRVIPREKSSTSEKLPMDPTDDADDFNCIVDVGMKTISEQSPGGLKSSIIMRDSGSGQYSFDYRSYKAEFEREMRLLSKLRHPSITTVMGAVIGKDEDPMLVMELMDVGSLYDLLHNDSVVFDGEMILGFLRDIAGGVRYLHASDPPVVHGDLKSKNILVDKRFKAKVADFGLAAKKRIGAVGTPYFMAPELLRNTTSPNTKTDCYAFGIMLYELYSRKNPYEGEDVHRVLHDVMDPIICKRPQVPETCPEKVQTLMKECQNMEPKHRPTFEELDLQLKRFDAKLMEPTNTVTISKKETPNSPLRSKKPNCQQFPPHVAELLRQGRSVPPETHQRVTVIFASAKASCDEADATKLYRKMGELAKKFGIFQIQTTGTNSFMAVANLIEEQADHVLRIYKFACLAITKAKKTLVDEQEPSKGCFDLAVGFHSGPITARVVGTRDPRYAIVGETISTLTQLKLHRNRILCTNLSARILRRQNQEIKLLRNDEGDVRSWFANEGTADGYYALSSELSFDLVGESGKVLSVRNLDL